MALAAIRTKIDEKLASLTWSGQPFSHWYNYYNDNIEGYPCIMYEPASIASAYEDTANNLRAYAFELLIVQEISVTSRSDAITAIIAAMDTVLNAFDEDYTLWGVARGAVEAVPGDFGQADVESWPVLMATIRLVCKDLIDIT